MTASVCKSVKCDSCLITGISKKEATYTRKIFKQKLKKKLPIDNL